MFVRVTKSKRQCLSVCFCVCVSVCVCMCVCFCVFVFSVIVCQSELFLLASEQSVYTVNSKNRLRCGLEIISGITLSLTLPSLSLSLSLSLALFSGKNR